MMESTEERRGSFMQFVVTPAPHDVAKADKADATTAWGRLAHSTNLLGYGLLVSFATVIFAAWLSSLEWTKEDRDDGVPRLENGAVLTGMVLPFSVFWVAYTCFHVYQATAYSDAGPHVVKVPFGLGVVLVPVFYGIHAAILSADIDSKYNGLDILLMFVFLLIFIVLEFGVRNKMTWDQKSQLESSPQQGAVSADVQPEQEKTTKQSMLQLLLSMISLFASSCVAFVYPFGVIPLFFSSSTWTRVGICLFLHPVLLEAMEALGRGQSADDVASKIRTGEISLEVAERQLVQGSVPQFGIKQIMAFYRRFMLLNMGSSDATLVALVVTAIEEAFTRGFLVQIDTAIRSLRGLPELSGDDLRLQRVVWMCDTNQSCIAEFNAILACSFVHVLLQRHAVIFAIGYELSEGVNTATVFVQLMVELVLEMLVDNTTMHVAARWAESEHGIPVVRYFAKANGIAVFGAHASLSGASLCFALYAFIRHPHFSSCDSSDVCDCLDQSMFREWVGDGCARSNVTVVSLNSTVATDPTHGLLGNVDFFAVTIALLSGVAILALIVLAVLFARYRKRQHVVVALQKGNSMAEEAVRIAEAENKSLKVSLARAQRSIDEVVKRSAAELKQHRVKFAELRFIEEIGQGAFGVVWKGAFRDKPVAIKTVRVTKVSKSVVKDFMREIKIMAPLRHGCLVHLVGGCWEDGPDKLCIVLEYCSRGSLKDLLTDQHSGHSWEAPYFAIGLGVASCFRYLHHEQPSGEPLIHRDLKPDNVMICDDMSPRVGDFGESTRFDQEEALRRAANEEDSTVLTMTVRDNQTVDVYSFAVTLLEIGCRNHLLVAKQFKMEHRFATTQGWRPRPSDELVEQQPELWKLVQACWSADPASRPTFVEIVRSVEALDPALGPGPSSTTTTPPPMILGDDSAKAPAQDLFEDKQRRAKARYQSLSRDELELSLLEAECSRDEAEASHDEMARRLRVAEEQIKRLKRTQLISPDQPNLH